MRCPACELVNHGTAFVVHRHFNSSTLHAKVHSQITTAPVTSDLFTVLRLVVFGTPRHRFQNFDANQKGSLAMANVLGMYKLLSLAPDRETCEADLAGIETKDGRVEMVRSQPSSFTRS